MNGPVLVLDAMSLLFRSFYALPPMNARDGTPTNALYGMSSLWMKLVREHRPRALAFAVDRPEPTFRHEAWADYKAGRAPTPDALSIQVARYAEWMAALDVPVHGVSGFEADDVIATIGADLGAAGTPVRVVSGDTDLFQVVTERVDVWYVGRRQSDAKLMDLGAVVERYGIDPLQIPTFKALVGDPSDNLPGLPGIGPKTASRWIRDHGDVAGILAAVDQLTPARHRDTVREREGALATSERLATVIRDVPLETPRAAPLTAAAVASMDAQFADLEFTSLRPRLAALAADLELQRE